MKNLKQLAKFMNSGVNCSYNETAKEEFRTIGLKAMKELAKALGLVKYDINFNAGGIAVSGDLRLMGMWNMSSGVYLTMDMDGYNDGFLYRTIKDMKDFSGGSNNWYNGNEMSNQEKLVETLLSLKKDGEPYAEPVVVKPRNTWKNKLSVIDSMYENGLPAYFEIVKSPLSVKVQADGESHTITAEDVVEYYNTEARSMSGYRTIGNITGDWRNIDELAKELLEIFKVLDVKTLKSEGEARGMALGV